MQAILTNPEDLNQVVNLQIRRRRDWLAVFSCEPSGEVWPFISRGYTGANYQASLAGYSCLLDEMVDAVVRVRWTGGRFFIDYNGVFTKPMKDYIQVARIELGPKNWNTG